MKTIDLIKSYLKMWGRLFESAPPNRKMFFKEYINNCLEFGFSPLPIVLIVSFFLGAVTTVQTAYQLVSPFIPKSTLGQIVRDSIILELSPTMVSLLLAGIVGSKMASELGNMVLTEQIDALEVMGINSEQHLILPKIMAAFTVMPLLVIISMFFGIFSGRLVASLVGVVTTLDFDIGIRSGFKTFNVIFALIKAYAFAVIISSVSSFFGYNAQRNALEIGRSGTRAVVYSSILILIMDFVLAKVLL